MENEQLAMGLHLPLQGYRVYGRGKPFREVATEEQAWELVTDSWAPYAVYDKEGYCEQFNTL